MPVLSANSSAQDYEAFRDAYFSSKNVDVANSSQKQLAFVALCWHPSGRFSDLAHSLQDSNGESFSFDTNSKPFDVVVSLCAQHEQLSVAKDWLKATRDSFGLESHTANRSAIIASTMSSLGIPKFMQSLPHQAPNLSVREVSSRRHAVVNSAAKTLVKRVNYRAKAVKKWPRARRFFNQWRRQARASLGVKKEDPSNQVQTDFDSNRPLFHAEMGAKPTDPYDFHLPLRLQSVSERPMHRWFDLVDDLRSQQIVSVVGQDGQIPHINDAEAVQLAAHVFENRIVFSGDSSDLFIPSCHPAPSAPSSINLN